MRHSNGLTQREVADFIGCSVGAYSKYETGDREPSITVLSRLADYYGVSVDYLVGRNVIDTETLSAYEKKLVETSRSSPDFVRKSVLDIMELLNDHFRKGNL